MVATLFGLSDWSQFLLFQTGIVFCRTAIMASLVQLGRSKFAAKYQITKTPSVGPKQHERESVWPIGFWFDWAAMGLAYYFGAFHNMEFWNGWTSFLWMFLIHITVVEFLYYWLHRLLHVKWVYKMYHQYHHASINTEAKTCLSFEIGERLSYTALFSTVPLLGYYMGAMSHVSLAAYFFWFDVNNGGGHINFEIFPDFFYSTPLGLFWYSASYHSIHHTRFKKNYSLFMPWPDLLFGTADMNLVREVFRKAKGGSNSLPSPAEQVHVEAGTHGATEEVFDQQIESQVVG